MTRSLDHAGSAPALVDEARAVLGRAAPRLLELEQRVADNVCGVAGPVAGSALRQSASIYFCLYTVPVLEAADWCDWEASPEASPCAEIQTALGLEIRLWDWLLDDDPHQLDRPTLVAAALALFARARELMALRGSPWSEGHEAMHSQFLLYERDVAAGFFHDFPTLWRRVSPLVALLEGEPVRSRLPKDFASAYRRYLAWSLLQADTEDLLEDLAAGIRTPVTVLALESGGGTVDAAAAAVAAQSVRRFLLEESVGLRTALASYGRMWPEIFDLFVARQREDEPEEASGAVAG